MAPHDAVALAVARVGESISASAGTVVLALLTLLVRELRHLPRSRHPARDRYRRHARRRSDAAAGVALDSRPSRVLAVEDRRWRAPGELGGARSPSVSLPARPERSRSACWSSVLLLSDRCFYVPAGFGGATAAPSGSDAAAGNAALAKYFPQSSTNPTNLILKLAAPVWQDPAAVVTAQSQLHATGLFTNLPGPLDPAGAPIPPAAYVHLHDTLGDPRLLPPLPAAGSAAAKVPTALYDAYRATARFVSPDGHTIQFEAGPDRRGRRFDRRAQRRPACPRCAHDRPAQHRRHRERRRRRSRSALRRELDLRRRPHTDRPDRHSCDRHPARSCPPQPCGSAVSDCKRAAVLPRGARPGIDSVHQDRR